MKTSNKLKILNWIVLTGLLLSACNLPSSDKTGTPGPDQVYTSAAQTVQAMTTRTPATVTPTTRPTATQPAAVTLPPIATVPGSTSTPSLACDSAEFVNDVTIPDDTLLKPDENFTKTWQLQNVGSCSWTTGYKIVFASGDAMNAPTAVSLPANVGPGQVVDISVNLTAPTQPGTYQAFFKLQNTSGQAFGLRSNRNGPFWVKIKVGGESFTVNSVLVVPDKTDATGACPLTINLTAAISASAAGKVTYNWEMSDGTKSSPQELNFLTAGTQPVVFPYVARQTGDYWARIYIGSPNNQYFPQTAFKVTCN